MKSKRPWAVTLVAVANILLALGITAELVLEMVEYGLEWTGQVEGGGAAAWLAMSELVFIPALVLVWVGVGLLRLDRAAWVLEVAIGVLLVPALGVGALILVALLPRSVRWHFGIGPDAVLAEIDAREEVGVSELASKFGVPCAAIRGLLEKAIQAGRFTGAFDRSSDLVFSADTIVTRGQLQRCPHCGGATEARGNLARCPYCGTRFAELTGLDHPMPAPIGLAVLRSLNALFAYFWIFSGAIWVTMLISYDLSALSFAQTVFAYLVCGLLPAAFAVAFYVAGWWLDDGSRRGWWLEIFLLPIAIPYLVRRRIRALYGMGLEPARAILERDGEVSMERLAELVGASPGNGDELAVFLTGTSSLDGVLDWHARRILTRERLARDGREKCGHCGAPFRIGGWCAYCGTGRDAGVLAGDTGV